MIYIRCRDLSGFLLCSQVPRGLRRDLEVAREGEGRLEEVDHRREEAALPRFVLSDHGRGKESQRLKKIAVFCVC